MFPIQATSQGREERAGAGMLAILLVAMTLGLFAAVPAIAQAQDSTSKQQSQPPTQPAPAEAGGPQTEVGPIAVPKKKEEAPPEAPKPRKAPSDLPDFSLRVDVPLVNVDVLVTTKDGQFIPGLKAGNFRVLEDGVPQKIATFSQAEAPITAVLLVEFAAINYNFVYDALTASYSFANSLKPNDWVALVYYDMKPHIVVDFTQDKRSIYGGLRSLAIPTWRETNLFDALYDTLDRVERIEGRKYVVLISTGIDTFSRLTYDNVLKKVKETHNVTIFAISTGYALREWADAHGYMGSIARLDFLQADNQMATFARMTGGQHWAPRFEAQFPEIFADIGSSIRNQYNLGYYPINRKQDGTYRKLKIELVDGSGGPLRIVNQKGKEVKYNILAREGYNARQVVE